MSHRNPLPEVQAKWFENISQEGILWLDLLRSLSIDIHVEAFTWNPASLAANTHVEETVSFSGLKVGDIVLAVIKPTFTQGFLVGQGRVSAIDTLAIQVVNGTGSASNPGSETYTFIYIKNTSK